MLDDDARHVVKPSSHRDAVAVERRNTKHAVELRADFNRRRLERHHTKCFVGFERQFNVGVVFDGNYDVTFYLDGVEVGKVVGSSAANSPKPTWHIAYKDPNYPEYFDGHLDDIQVYDGVLTADDMRWLYENPGQELARLGESVCDGLPNSTGSASTLEATGSDRWSMTTSSWR